MESSLFCIAFPSPLGRRSGRGECNRVGVALGGCPRDGTETVPYREAKLGVNIEYISLKEDYDEVA